MHACTIAGLECGNGAAAPASAPWFERLAYCIHDSEVQLAGSDVEPRLRQLLEDPEVREDLDARRLCLNALGCDLVRQAQRLGPGPSVEPRRLALVDRAIESFEAATGLPEASVNLAAALIERARLSPSGARAALLERARQALAEIDADALAVPWQRDSFLGLRSRGARIALLIDASGGMTAETWLAVKRAVLASIDALGPDTRLGVWTFGGDPRSLASTGGEALVARDQSGSVASARAAVTRFLDGAAPGGSGSLVRAVEEASASQPTDIFVLSTVGALGPDSAVTRLGPELARRGIVVHALVLAPSYRSDPSLEGRCIDGALGMLARHTGGPMRILLGGQPCPLSGQSCRALAEREGRWPPALERQLLAVRSQISLLAGVRGEALAPSASDSDRALAALAPDPLPVPAGPARSDIRCLLLAAATAAHSGDRAGADRCLRDAAELAGAEAEAARADPDRSAVLREQGARAELLRAMYGGTPVDQCLDHARRHGLLAGAWSPESWSARLLGATDGGIAAFRARQSLDADPDVRARQLRELAVVRAWASDGCKPLAPGLPVPWDGLPGADERQDEPR
jgi:hypothetical protein